MYDFAYGNGIYVATGQNESVQGAGQPVKMFYSNDGINWSLTNTIPGWANQWVVTFGNNKFVALVTAQMELIGVWLLPLI